MRKGETTPLLSNAQGKRERRPAGVRAFFPAHDIMEGTRRSVVEPEADFMMRTVRIVRASHPIAALLVLACTAGRSASSRAGASVASAPPVGLYGAWVSTQDRTARPDTLLLLPNSVARGRVARPGQPAITASRWQIKYLSKDSRNTRRDQMGGPYQDGGDLSCTVAPDSTCVSAPVFCIGGAGTLDCMGFRFHGDSLALSNGAKYRRAPRS
jgi:hypothetical protein